MYFILIKLIGFALAGANIKETHNTEQTTVAQNWLTRHFKEIDFYQLRQYLPKHRLNNKFCCTIDP